MNNYDDILLTFHEKRILFSLLFCKKKNGNVHDQSHSKLYEYGLIKQNFKSLRDKEGNLIPDDTFSLTDRFHRYRIYVWRDRFRRYFTPFVVALLTSIGVHLSEELWLPVLLDYLKGLL